MDFAALWNWMETVPLVVHIAETWWFPLFESLHVLTATFVVGAILMIDLRLLSLAARSQTMTTMLRELVPWTWGAFVLCAIAGIALFMTRASVYIENPAMQIKLILLLLMGINMAVLHFISLRDVIRWDCAEITPLSAQIAGTVSLLGWIGVMLAGRWTGHLSG